MMTVPDKDALMDLDKLVLASDSVVVFVQTGEVSAEVDTLAPEVPEAVIVVEMEITVGLIVMDLLAFPEEPDAVTVVGVGIIVELIVADPPGLAVALPLVGKGGKPVETTEPKLVEASEMSWEMEKLS